MTDKIGSTHLQPKVFIGLTEVSGYYTLLNQGLNELGVRTTLVGPALHKFSYNQPVNTPIPVRIYTRFMLFRHSVEQSGKKVGFFMRVLTLASSLYLFIWAILTHDVFIFSFGRSFFYSGADLFWLKKFKKKVISMVGHGSEARPPYIDGAYRTADGEVVDPERISFLTKRIVANLSIIEKYSDIVVCAPLTGHLLKKKFVNQYFIGTPALNQLPCKQEARIDKIKILHSPSQPKAKGTTEILRVIDELRDNGFDFEFKFLSGISNAEVKKELSTSSFVIDQLYSDWCLPGLATEAAACKCPTVIGGFGWEEIKKNLPPKMIPSSIMIDPAELKEKVKELLLDKDKVNELGNEAYEFVLNNWSPEEVAKKFLRLISGDVPKEWFYEPREISYLWGYAYKREDVIKTVRSYVEAFGAEALYLDHNPKLKEEFLELIKR